GRAALCAQAAVQADVFVFYQHALGGEVGGDIQILREVVGRCAQFLAQDRLLGIFGEGNALCGADVGTGIAFDTTRFGEYRLHVAVQAALGFLDGGFDIETELDLKLAIGERDLHFGVRHFVAPVVLDFAVIAPLVHAHLLADGSDPWRRTLAHVDAAAEQIDRNGGLMTLGNCGDDVLGAKGRVAAEEHFRVGRLVSDFVNDRHIPFAEVEADIALDPRKRVFLPDGDQHVIAFEEHMIFAGGNQRALAVAVVNRLHFFEGHADQLAVLHHELDRHVILVHRDTFAFGVFDFPWRRFHFSARAAHDDIDALAAETHRGAAAIHRGIAAAEHDDLAANFLDMTEGHAGEPVDTDMDVRGPFIAAGNLQIAPAWGTGADEYGVVTLVEHTLEAVDLAVEVRHHTHIEDVA